VKCSVGIAASRAHGAEGHTRGSAGTVEIVATHARCREPHREPPPVAAIK
jgi:hypothetical protein